MYLIIPTILVCIFFCTAIPTSLINFIQLFFVLVDDNIDYAVYKYYYPWPNWTMRWAGPYRFTGRAGMCVHVTVIATVKTVQLEL